MELKGVIMSLEIFRCHNCGAKVQWSATECPVCHRLVSNDRAKRRIVIAGFIAVLFVAAIVLLLAF